MITEKEVRVGMGEKWERKKIEEMREKGDRGNGRE